MWPIGSAPEVDGAPPVLRTHLPIAVGEYPTTGPPIAARLWRPPRVSIHITQGPTGYPLLVDGHGARPLPGARDRDDLLGPHDA